MLWILEKDIIEKEIQDYVDFFKEETKLDLYEKLMLWKLVELFAKSMENDDIIIIPYNTYFFAIKVGNDFSYGSNSEITGYKKSPIWLFDGKALSITELPKEIQHSIQNNEGLINISNFKRLFKNFKHKKENNIIDLEELIEKSLEILREAIQSDNQDIKLRAAISLLDYSKNQ